MSTILQIDANTADTGWIDTSWLADDIAFNLTGTWTGTIALDTSFEPYQQGVTRSKYSTPTTYTANQAPLGLPRTLGSFIRFRRVAWTSGTAYIGLSNGKDQNNRVLPVTLESTKLGNSA